ncbi:aspartate/glutamate racemase family protein [Maribacter aurantiacus]|uniref:Aspartate/glutamate racemase family protein n=1 Tax=Maribacter aurantiacus TaxID=1882343 RepID=A0A5R8M5X4_9FLAO|nr:aspartate/glutamate racemase family protein [Maribacter aurantiacus]TLF44933.1 aspartate/glutamate racemase family protein [Maribacter aurantiacus]
MKKIGLIGGITWQSTQLYYQYLNEIVNSKLGGSHSCKLVMESVDFHEISKKQSAGDWESLNKEFANIGRRLEQTGAEMILIGANTMHLCADSIKKVTNIPLLHIAEATGQAVVSKGIDTVLLLGTKYTMGLDFYKDILKTQFGITTMIPKESDQELVHNIIYTELSKGIISPESREVYLRIIDAGVKAGAKGVILGCTEIPLLIQQEHCNIPTFDTTLIHSNAAVNFALAE